MSSSAPPPAGPGAGPLGPSAKKDPQARGVLKWGLLGCAVLSVVALVGMVLFLRKAPQLVESLLGATEAQVVAAIVAEVPSQDREAFRTEYAAFVATAKSGSANPKAIQGLKKKIVEALKDERVDVEELRGLTDHLRSMPKP
jgi:hypothetical protein